MDEARKSFCRSLHRNDAAAARELLGADAGLRAAINEPIGPFGGRPMNIATGRETIDVLLDFGADPDLGSDWSEGPFRALDHVDEPTARYLVSRGATLTPHAAARFGWLEELRELIDFHPQLVHQPGGDGKRPLHWSANVAVADLLLGRLADVDARCLDHLSTAAQYALTERPEVCGHLLDHGATPDVFMSAHRGDMEMLREQLDRRPEVAGHILSRPGYNRVPPECIYNWTLGFGNLPHDVAFAAGQQEALDLLMSRSPPELRLAAWASIGDEPQARALLAEAPDLLQRMNGILHGRLATAAFFGHVEAARLMLALGFEPSATGHDGGTALHAASWAGSAGVVEAILARPGGGDLIGVRDARYGATPLGWCCHGSLHGGVGEHARVTGLLLAHGAAAGADTTEASAAVRAVLEGWA